MKISENFTLQELVKSSTATRLGIRNIPDRTVVNKLTLLTVNILQPVRNYFKRPVIVNSGFRNLELNRILKSKDSSQHVTGEAVDLEIPGISNYDLAVWIRDNLEFDQLILEYYESGEPSSGWVHVSFTENSNRRSILTINSKGVSLGLIK